MKVDTTVSPNNIPLGLTNWREIPTVNKFLLSFSTGFVLLLLVSILIAKYNIYATPKIFKGNSIMGKILSSTTLKKLHKEVRMKKPKATPKQNFMLLFNPCWFAYVIAKKLLGPGVKLLINTNNKKENIGISKPPIFCVL